MASVDGVELANGKVRSASLLVSNVDLPTTECTLLPPKEKAARKRAPRMTPGVITFYWGIRGQIDRLGHHTIFLPDDYRGAFDDLFTNNRIPSDPPFYVSVPSATDPTLAPEGDTVAFVLVPTPLLSQMPTADWRSEVRQVREKVLRKLARHGVDIDPARIVVEDVLSPLDWKARFGLHDGSAFGASHTLSQIGPFRARNYSKNIKGLYFVGASTTPGTGMPMVVLGGKRTAERILSHAR